MLVNAVDNNFWQYREIQEIAIFAMDLIGNLKGDLI